MPTMTPQKKHCWQRDKCCCCSLRLAAAINTAIMIVVNTGLLILSSDCQDLDSSHEPHSATTNHKIIARLIKEFHKDDKDRNAGMLSKNVWIQMNFVDIFDYAYLVMFNCNTWARIVVMGFCVCLLVLNTLLLITILIKPTILMQICLQQLMFSSLICHITSFVIFLFAAIAIFIVYSMEGFRQAQVVLVIIVGVALPILFGLWAYFLWFVCSYYEALKEDILPANIPQDVQHLISELHLPLEGIENLEPAPSRESIIKESEDILNLKHEHNARDMQKLLHFLNTKKMWT